MGMFDDYFRPVPPSPTTRGLASIGDALSQVMKAKEARDLQAAQAQAAFEEQRMRDTASMEREVYQQQQMGERDRLQRDAAQRAAQLKAGQEGADKVYTALEAGDPRAQGLATAYGIGMGQRQREQAPLPEYQEVAPTGDLEMDVATNDQGFKRVEGERARVETQNKRNRELDIQDPLHVLTLPGGAPVEYSRGQALQGRKGHGAMVSEQLTPLAGVLGKHGPAAVRAQQERMRTGFADPKADPAQAAIDAARRAAEMEARAKRPRGRGGDGLTPSQRATNEARELTGLGARYQEWEGSNQVKDLVAARGTFVKMQDAAENARTDGDRIGQQAALYGAAKYITGVGVLTAEEYKNTVTNTGGAIAGLISRIKKGFTGEISDQEQALLEKFIGNANEMIRKKGAALVRNFDKRFASSAYAKAQPEEMQAYRDALIDRFQISDEEVNAASPKAVKAAEPDLDALYKQVPK